MYEIIKKNPEYQLLFKSNKRFSGNFFTVLMNEDTELENTRIGIITGKKVGKAVVRNKIKRRIRAYLNAHKDSIISIRKRIVILAKRTEPAESWQEFSEDLDNIFEEIMNYI